MLTVSRCTLASPLSLPTPSWPSPLTLTPPTRRGTAADALTEIVSKYILTHFFCVSKHCPSPHPHCRGAAADVLTEIVSKRMEAIPKLALIQQLGVVPVSRIS